MESGFKDLEESGLKIKRDPVNDATEDAENPSQEVEPESIPDPPPAEDKPPAEDQPPAVLESPPKEPEPPADDPPALVEEPALDFGNMEDGGIDFAALGGGGMSDEEKAEIMGKIESL